jgi:hypothetical protein
MPTRLLPPSSSSLEGALMLDATLWQVDMGDGTWAVCCLTCQTPLYRGPKPIADLVFDTHGCERVLPLTTSTPTPRRPR